jgi:phenylacetate-CoA ligase
MSDYETRRQQHVSGALVLAPRLIEQMSWPAGRLAEHRALRLRELVRIATERSPWYRKRLSGVDIDRLDERSLAGLPVLTRAELMEHFDDIVTDSRLTLAGLEAHLSTAETGSYLLGRYTALTSGGSSGQRGVFV